MYEKLFCLTDSDVCMVLVNVLNVTLAMNESMNNKIQENELTHRILYGTCTYRNS
jgi:hypothetical protein